MKSPSDSTAFEGKRAAPERPVVAVVGSRDAARGLAAVGFDTTSLRRTEDAYNTATAHRERAIVVEARSLRKDDAHAQIAELRKRRPLTDVLIWSREGASSKVVAAMRGGARDAVLVDDPAALAARVREVVDDQVLLPQVQSVHRARKRNSRFEGMVSRSQVMWDLFEASARVAPTMASVLLLGETGTGKELLARAIHRRSGRTGRFVAVNCSALPEGLVDAELFGHERGTFTGATQSREGLFRHAQGGTILLDEIGNVPLSGQFSLLRVLQEERIRPVGSHEEIPVDVRVIAATSEPLEAAVERGAFREDLLYRLDVIRLVVPPLRDRAGDLPFVFHHLARQLAKDYKLPRPQVTESFLSAVQAHPWPGNVRQLANFTERLVLTHPNEVLTGRHFEELTRPYQRGGPPRDVQNPGADAGLTPTPETAKSAPSEPRTLQGAPPRAEPSMPPPSRVAGPTVDLERSLASNVDPAVEAVERAYFDGLLRRYHGRVGLTAEHAGVNRRTVLRKLKALGLEKETYRSLPRPD